MRRTPSPVLDTALPFGLVGIRDWLDRRNDRKELDRRRDALAERAEDLAESGLPGEVREHLDRADDADDVAVYRSALDDAEDAITRYRDLAGRHAALVERLRRARERVEDADPPFAIPFDRFERVLERSDPTEPTTSDLDDAERAVRSVERILDVVEGFDYGALDELFPVEAGALAGAAPTKLYEGIEDPDDLSALADHLNDLAELVETLADEDLEHRSRMLASTDLPTGELADGIGDAIWRGDPDRCRKLLEQAEHTEALDDEIAELREEIDELGWPTLEVDVTAILDDLDTMDPESGIGMTRRRLRFYEDAVNAVRDLNAVASSRYEFDTEEVREALREGFEDVDRETVGDAAKRASDLADVVEKAETVEAMLRDRGEAAVAGTDGGAGDASLAEQLDRAVEERDLATLNRLEERLRRVEDADWSRRDFFKFTPDGVLDLVADLWRERGATVEPHGDRSLVAERDGDRELVYVLRRQSTEDTLNVERLREAAREARRADAERAVLVTNAGFTNRARENAEKATPPVEPVDGEELAERLTEAQIEPPL